MTPHFVEENNLNGAKFGKLRIVGRRAPYMRNIIELSGALWILPVVKSITIVLCSEGAPGSDTEILSCLNVNDRSRWSLLVCIAKVSVTFLAFVSCICFRVTTVVTK